MGALHPSAVAKYGDMFGVSAGVAILMWVKGLEFVFQGKVADRSGVPEPILSNAFTAKMGLSARHPPPNRL